MIEGVVQGVTVFLNQVQYIKYGIEIKYFGILLALMTIIKLSSYKSYKVSEKFGQQNSIVFFSFAISISTGILSIYSMIGSMVSVVINPVVGITANTSLRSGMISCFIIAIVGSTLIFLLYKTNRDII